MAHPAKDARDAVIAKYPDAVVSDRARNSIKHSVPSLPNKFVLDVGIGPMHYGVLEDQEIDTAWQPGTAPWDFEMVSAGYNAFALEDFSSGQIIKYVDPDSGEDITFQPQQLQYTNDLDQIQAIANPQAVNAVVQNEDGLFWSGAYGTGFDFRWQAQTARLDKRLVVDQASRFPTPEQFIVDGSNPVLSVQFIFAPSSGLDIYVNDVLWDRQPNNLVDTSGLIEFRVVATGETAWHFNLPRSNGAPVEDQDPDQLLGIFRLRRTGPNLFVEHRIPVSWLQAADYPIEIDVTVDEQVGASSDDARENATNVTLTDANFNPDETNEYVGLRWSSVTITSGATVDVATIDIWIDSEAHDEPQHPFGFEDAASPPTFATSPTTNISDRTLTTASVTYGDGTSIGIPAEGAFISSRPIGTVDVKSIVEELVASHNYSAGAPMVCVIQGTSIITDDFLIEFYDSDTTKAAKLHIEYTSGITDLSIQITADASYIKIV